MKLRNYFKTLCNRAALVALRADSVLTAFRKKAQQAGPLEIPERWALIIEQKKIIEDYTWEVPLLFFFLSAAYAMAGMEFVDSVGLLNAELKILCLCVSPCCLLYAFAAREHVKEANEQQEYLLSQ